MDKVEEMKEERRVQDDEIEVLRDKVLCCKNETDLLEGDSQNNRKEEIEVLHRKCHIKDKSLNYKEKEWFSIKCDNDKKIETLNEVLKEKSRQLVKYLNHEMIIKESNRFCSIV